MQSRAYFDSSKTRSVSRKRRRAGTHFRTDSVPEATHDVDIRIRGVSAPRGAEDAVRPEAGRSRHGSSLSQSERSRGRHKPHVSAPTSSVDPLSTWRVSVDASQCDLGAGSDTQTDPQSASDEAPRRGPHFRTNSAPDGDTLTLIGNRDVNDPGGRAGRTGRVKPGSFTSGFNSHHQSEGSPGRRTPVKRTCDSSWIRAAQGPHFRTDSAPDDDTPHPHRDRGVNDPGGRAGRTGRAEPGSSRHGSIPIPIRTVAGAA
jgi:hypothetical protein